MMVKKCFLAVACILLINNVIASSFVKDKRSMTNINENWHYSENVTNSVTEIQKNSEWKLVQLPHTWNNEDTVDAIPGYRRNASWYKKELNFDAIDQLSKYSLYFEGTNITSEVYVNETLAGGHIGGYLGFEVDITNLVKKGTNFIYVRVDNSYNPHVIPSQKSDFFIYGGITRDVWLMTKPISNIKKIKVTTPSVSKSNAILQVDVLTENLSQLKANSIKVELFDPSDNLVSTKSKRIKTNNNTIHFKSILSPKLWDVDDPNLYTVKVSLMSEEKKIDEVLDRVGFRWFEFKDNGPFYLNGRRLLLRGTHRHEEHAGVGAAMTNKQHRKDMELIKEMGANFVRLAHYPQDPEIYKACDELGLLVWDELPWCRGGLGDTLWQENSKRLLSEMIDQNYNHPSIILWSLGNEIYWLPDFEDGDNRDRINTFLSELNELAHEMDPTRKTAIRKYYEGSHLVDVFSPSIWSGWYSGSYKSYQKAINTYKPQYKHFLHAEYGGSSHVGRHTENPITGEGVINSEGWEEEIVQTKVDNIAKIGDWSENYIVDLFDWHLRISETDPSFVGNAQWAVKDFGTPLRPENAIPYINQKGLFDRAGNPKDAYYVFKSYWSKKPFVYIESHTWTERQGPQNKTKNLSVYSNCEKVTLFLNGQNLGVKTRNIKDFPASGLNWDVNFKEGKNTLKAIGVSKDGVEVVDNLTINYRYTKNDAAKKLTLESKKLENGNYLITATAVDGKGLRCLDYEKRVYFQCLSGGTTLKNQGTPTGSEVIEMANGKAAIEIKPNKEAKEINVTVLNQSFKGTFHKISL